MFVIILDVDHHAVLSDGDAPNGPQVGKGAIWERFEVEFTDESWLLIVNIALKRETFHDFDARRLLDNPIECHRGARNVLIDIADYKGAIMEAVRKNPHDGSVRLAIEVIEIAVAADFDKEDLFCPTE